jgi:N-acetyl-gamma-glutamyl-phosphate reductase
VVDPAERLPQVGDVAGTNFCDLSPVVDPAAGTIVVVGVIDNLIKGAAGQAVQLMNLACGLDETAGLL